MTRDTSTLLTKALAPRSLTSRLVTSVKNLDRILGGWNLAASVIAENCSSLKDTGWPKIMLRQPQVLVAKPLASTPEPRVGASVVL